MNNNKQITDYLTFGNQNVSETIASLSIDEMTELNLDLQSLILGLRKDMELANFFEAQVLSNQRLNGRMFTSEIWMDLSPDKDDYILINKFDELSIDEYLDSINEHKSLSKKDFNMIKVSRSV